MASYRVTIKPSVERDLRVLPKVVLQRIWARIEGLSVDPIPRQSTKIAGAEHLYRLRVGDYRIIYGIDHELKNVLVHYVRHRREAYRGL